MGNKVIQRICVNAIMIDLFLILGFLRIRVGGFLEIGFGSIVIAFVAILYGPLDAVIVAALGETINQLFFSPYGASPTLPLWVLPVVVRALLIGLLAWRYKKKGDHITNHIVVYYFSLMGVALIVSGLDTGLLYLDGIIMHYPVSYTFVQTIIRFFSSQVTAIICASITLPLYKGVMKALPRLRKKDVQEEHQQQ